MPPFTNPNGFNVVTQYLCNYYDITPDNLADQVEAHIEAEEQEQFNSRMPLPIEHDEPLQPWVPMFPNGVPGVLTMEDLEMVDSEDFYSDSHVLLSNHLLAPPEDIATTEELSSDSDPDCDKDFILDDIEL